MRPRKRLSIKSATIVGIAVSALLGLAGLTLNPAPARRSCTASTLNIRPAALPPGRRRAQASSGGARCGPS